MFDILPEQNGRQISTIGKKPREFKEEDLKGTPEEKK